MPSVVVIGGGFAGLKTAVTLVDAGIPVTLLEARATLGGRARSFIDPATGEVVDNGQHLFLAGYRHTLEFLSRCGTRQHILFQKRLRVSFVEKGGKIRTLDCPPIAAPWHLILGLLRFSGLSARDKRGLWRIFREVSNGSSLEHDGESVQEWLIRRGQSKQGRRTFWYPLAVATLNEDPSKASAQGLVAVLRTLSASPWRQARLGMACVGLGDLYADAARRIIEEKIGTVFLQRPVARLEIEDSRVKAVHLLNGSSVSPDAVVSTLPPPALLRILPSCFRGQDPALQFLHRFTSSPIVSINLWLDRPVTKELFVGMIGTRIQWLFNKPAILRLAREKVSYLSLIISAAAPFIDQTNEALVAMAMEDLQACFPKSRQARLIRCQVVREREATVSLSAGSERFRPGPVTNCENLFLAGDWTATGLPATIESAVVSGYRASQEVLKWLQRGFEISAYPPRFAGRNVEG